MTTRTRARNFVLVHGAWHGGWCWRDVVTLLRHKGHLVSAPTMTGLGERSHLLSNGIDLDTHITDITNHLIWNELRNVVLVGHSYGGAVVLGVADRLPERITELILLDAAFIGDGETCLDELAEDVAAERVRQAHASSGGLTLPVPPATAFGLTDPAQQDWVSSKLTPHPLKTYTTALRLRGPVGNNLKACYIACTAPRYPLMVPILKRVQTMGWPVHELTTGHDAMISAPGPTTRLLEKISEPKM